MKNAPYYSAQFDVQSPEVLTARTNGCCDAVMVKPKGQSGVAVARQQKCSSPNLKCQLNLWGEKNKLKAESLCKKRKFLYSFLSPFLQMNLGLLFM